MMKMLPRLALLLRPLPRPLELKMPFTPSFAFSTSFRKPIYPYMFSTYPKHDVLTMPALSPTMTEGKIIKWLKNVGDKLEPGDTIAQIQTDKATVGFQVQDKGYLAQVRQTSESVPVGTPVVVVVKKADAVKDFSSFSFTDSPTSAQQPPKQESAKQQPPKHQPPKHQATSSKPKKSYPKHSELKMPALSPTMSEGKILSWKIKEGDEFTAGDALCDIETDKATVTYEASEKGVLAKILAPNDAMLPVGSVLGVSVRKKGDIDAFKDYKIGDQESSPTEKQVQKQEVKAETPRSAPSQSTSGNRVFASPAAKTLANQKGINLSEMGQGSGPNGRIIKQDVEGYEKPVVQKKVEAVSKPEVQKKVETAVKSDFPQNPFEQIPINSMRKTIAARLTQSKTTIPHYYINCSIEMDAVIKFRTELNLHEKQNGVKISVNDIIVKAMALALRDYPVVNSQWHGTSVRRFKHADVSVAVATDGGLITPIVFRAETLGLIDIAKRTKDIAKRAREGKLDPREFIGGTSTVSNLGMFGINTVTSVINPPQSTILGVGKTEKKIIFDETADPEKPYKVANVMQVIVSADHRVVDGAVAAQWVTRIKRYLENPIHMLL